MKDLARGLGSVVGFVALAWIVGQFVRGAMRGPLQDPASMMVGLAVGLGAATLVLIVRSRQSAALGLVLVAVLLVAGTMLDGFRYHPFVSGVWAWAAAGALLVRLARPVAPSAEGGNAASRESVVMEPPST